jgi:hypothetical protein
LGAHTGDRNFYLRGVSNAKTNDYKHISHVTIANVGWARFGAYSVGFTFGYG